MNTLLKKIWKLKTPYQNIPLLDRVTKHRDLDLQNELSEYHSPWLLKNMEIAVKRVQKAIKDRERIMIYGDYDVDGIVGSSILYLGLKDLGANVSVRLPHREKDGYGLNQKIISECHELGVNLLITVDCGISNVEEIEIGNKLGVDTIITDHHSIPPQLPGAFAILNPKQKDCKYPEKEIVGAVVALKLLTALSEKFLGSSGFSPLGSPEQSHGVRGRESVGGQENFPKNYLDLAALATVADCAPLTGENRLIVKNGLLQFEHSQHRGLRTLVTSNQLTSNQLTSYHLGYIIGPCVNAAGRIEDPLLAFKAMTGDETKAKELIEINRERQNILRTALIEANELVEKYHSQDQILIFWNEHWQPGIIGLLAGKLCEQYNRPAICLTKNKDIYIGSCRSIPEINIIEELNKHSELFINFGGHAQAAGLSLTPENLEIFRSGITQNIADFVKKNPIESALNIDTEIQTPEIKLETSKQLSRLEPFGIGNPKPKFLLKNVKLNASRPVGKTGAHLKFSLSKDGQLFPGIGFNLAEHEDTLKEWQNLDIVCQLNTNEFNGKVSVDVQMVDAKNSEETRK